MTEGPGTEEDIYPVSLIQSVIESLIFQIL